MTPKRTFALGALLAGFGVALGAFGAHALQGQVPEARLDAWKTAVLYQLVHALALLGLGLARQVWPELAAWPATLMLAGTLVFSGSLYLLVLTDTAWLGAITPLGGLCLIAGWLGLAVSAWRRQTAV